MTRTRISSLMVGAATACCCLLATTFPPSAVAEAAFVPSFAGRATTRTSSASGATTSPFGPAAPFNDRAPARAIGSVSINGNGGENSPSSLRAKPKIAVIEGLQDFLDFLSEDDRLCIVKFHASWCKSCQAFAIKYKKLAREEGDKCDRDGKVLEKGRVRFAEVEFTANAKLCRTLGVKRLPYIHMYRGADGRLCEFACGPKKFPTVIEKMNEYLGMSPDEIEFDRVMNAGDRLGDDVLLELRKETYERAIRYANVDDGEEKEKKRPPKGKQAEL